MGVQGGSWDFFPKTDSGPESVTPQRIFTLSLGESAGWQPGNEDRKLISTFDLKNGDLSLKRSRGGEKDAGNYVCRLDFKDGRRLEKSVRVHVLQSELKQALTPADFCFFAPLYRPHVFLLLSGLLAARPTNCHSREVVVGGLFFYLFFTFFCSASPFLLRCTELLFSSLGGRVYLDGPRPGFDVCLIQTFNTRRVPTGHNELPLCVITQ